MDVPQALTITKLWIKMIIKRNQKDKYLKIPPPSAKKNNEQEQFIQYQEVATPPSQDEDYSQNLYNAEDDYDNSFSENDESEVSIDQLLNNYENDLGIEDEPLIDQNSDFSDENFEEEDDDEDVYLPNSNMPIIQDRKERRRGDRRRGYRRLDDKNLISRAQEECNAIKERAAKEGFEYGLSCAKDELQVINNTMHDFLKAKEIALESVSSEIAFLAIQIAEKIIRTEISCDETIILSILSEVIKGIGKDETKIIIKTHSADSIIVKSNIPKLFPYADVTTKIIVMEDDEVEWGSCIVETNNGMIDARFSTQLQILSKAFESGI